jgi:hypothetical protein
MKRDCDREQDEDRRVRDRLEHDPVEERTDRENKRDAERDLGKERQRAFADQEPCRDRQERQPEPNESGPTNPRGLAAAKQGSRLDRKGDRGQDRDEPDRPGNPAELKEAERQRRIGDEVAEGHEDHAGRVEYEHDPERHHGVDRARRDPVLRNQEPDVEIHARETVILRR